MTFRDVMTKPVPLPVEEEEVCRPPSVLLEIKHRRYVGEGKGFVEVPYYRCFVYPKKGKDYGCIFPSELEIMDLSARIFGNTETVLNAKIYETYLILDIVTEALKDEEKIEDLLENIGKPTYYRE
jgi:hypothetical protein